MFLELYSPWVVCVFAESSWSSWKGVIYRNVWKEFLEILTCCHSLLYLHAVLDVYLLVSLHRLTIPVLKPSYLQRILVQLLNILSVSVIQPNLPGKQGLQPETTSKPCLINMSLLRYRSWFQLTYLDFLRPECSVLLTWLTMTFTSWFTIETCYRVSLLDWIRGVIQIWQLLVWLQASSTFVYFGWDSSVLTQMFLLHHLKSLSHS